MNQNVILNKEADPKFAEVEEQKLKDFRALRQWIRENKPLSMHMPVEADYEDRKILHI